MFFFAVVSFLVSSSYETFVKENRCFFGGAIVVRISRYMNDAFHYECVLGQINRLIDTMVCAFVCIWPHSVKTGPPAGNKLL